MPVGRITAGAVASRLSRLAIRKATKKRLMEHGLSWRLTAAICAMRGGCGLGFSGEADGGAERLAAGRREQPAKGATVEQNACPEYELEGHFS